MAPKPKFTAEQEAEIVAYKAANPDMPNATIGEKFGCGRGMVDGIIRRATAAPAALRPALLGRATFAQLEHSTMAPDPTQPRRSFAGPDLEELADSIAERGLLQFPLVRPANENGVHVIIAGERRWRAIGILIAAGTWTGPVPATIREGDELSHKFNSIVENLQRAGITPLEEANAFADLITLSEGALTPTEIAQQIGKTPRFVQQRLALARDLIPEGQILLRHHIVTVEGARKLAGAPADIQRQALESALEMDANQITDAGAAYPPGSPLRPVPWYEYEPLDTEALIGEVDYFTRQGEAQVRAAEATAERAALAADDTTKASAKTNEQPTAEDDDTAPSAPHPAPPAAEAQPQTAPAPPYTNSHAYHAHRRKSRALRTAVAANPHVAKLALCAALLTVQPVVMLKTQNFWGDYTREDDPGEDEALTATVTKLAGAPQSGGYRDGQIKPLWKRLTDLRTDDLDRLLAALIARHVVTPAGLQPELGDHPFAQLLAHTLGLAGHEAAHGLALQREDLAGLRKPLLLGLVDETGAPGVNDESKSAALADAIASTGTSYVLPSLRFGPTKAIIQDMQEIAK